MTYFERSLFTNVFIGHSLCSYMCLPQCHPLPTPCQSPPTPKQREGWRGGRRVGSGGAPARLTPIRLPVTGTLKHVLCRCSYPQGRPEGRRGRAAVFPSPVAARPGPPSTPARRARRAWRGASLPSPSTVLSRLPFPSSSHVMSCVGKEEHDQGGKA